MDISHVFYISNKVTILVSLQILIFGYHLVVIPSLVKQDVKAHLINKNKYISVLIVYLNIEESLVNVGVSLSVGKDELWEQAFCSAGGLSHTYMAGEVKGGQLSNGCA